jgi:hypothetical protein
MTRDGQLEYFECRFLVAIDKSIADRPGRILKCDLDRLVAEPLYVDDFGGAAGR